jgi:hypothetical protein
MTETEVLEAALIGLGHQCSQLDEKMAELRTRLGIRGGGVRVSSVAVTLSSDGVAPLAGPRRGRMSAAGRRRIAEAQRKRWAALRQGTGKPAAPLKKNRRISAAGQEIGPATPEPRGRRSLPQRRSGGLHFMRRRGVRKGEGCGLAEDKLGITMSEEQTVKSLLREWADAHKRTDISALEHLYADDWVYTDFMGTVWDKAKVSRELYARLYV